jgi:hypothetical protein
MTPRKQGSEERFFAEISRSFLFLGKIYLILDPVFFPISGLVSIRPFHDPASVSSQFQLIS